MYALFFVQATGFLLLTHNLFIGGVYLAALTLVVISRVGNEEAAMVEKFGDAYRNYMKKTGRFLPRFPGY
jgi:protein-S-isoprenylcysteine O-methyltransferase Ste14